MRLVKQRAVSEGRTVTSLVEEGLRAVLERGQAVARYEVDLPSVSVGGPAPGVDLDNWEQIKNLMYAEEDAHFRSLAGDAAASPPE